MTATYVRAPDGTRRPQLFPTRRVLYSIANHAVAIAVALCFLLPFLIVAVTALMTQNQAGSGSLWPRHWAWHNFADVFTAMPFARDLWNTVLYAGLSTLGVVLSSVPVAYALSRLKWRGREVMFMVVLATMMIPAQVTSLPLYVVFSKLGWVNSLRPLIIPSFFGDAFSIFLLRQFFMTIPQEMTEAARCDGANDWRILTRIVVPMARPAIAAVGLFAFLYAWNDFYNPLLYTGNSTNSQTLAVGLTTLAKTSHQNAYQLQMAASIIFLAPVLLLFFFAQKVFVEGVTLTGVKG